jgi:hypothetical protein
MVTWCTSIFYQTKKENTWDGFKWRSHRIFHWKYQYSLFKSGLKTEESVNIIYKASALSDNRLIPVDQLSNCHRTTVRVGET